MTTDASNSACSGDGRRIAYAASVATMPAAATPIRPTVLTSADVPVAMTASMFASLAYSEEKRR